MRLGREWCACAFLAVSRYRADVIRNKLRENFPSEMNGKTQEKTENDALFRSHITLAYCYVETRFEGQTADEAIDFVVVQTESEYVARVVRYRSPKCVWSDQKSGFRVSLAQRESGSERAEGLKSILKSSEQIVPTATIFTLQACRSVIL